MPTIAFFKSLRANLHLATSVDLSLPSPSSSSTHLPISSPQITSVTLPDQHVEPLRAGLSNDPTSLSSTTPHTSTTHPTKHISNPTQPFTPFPISTHTPTTPSSFHSAQHLISSSVSETRGRVYTSIVRHPLTLLCYTLILLIIFLNRALHRGSLSGLGLSDLISISMRAIVAAWVLLGGLWALVCCGIRDSESGNLRDLDDRELGIGGVGGGGREEDSLVLVSERERADGRVEVVGTIVMRRRKIRLSSVLSPSGFSHGHGHVGCCRRSVRAARKRRARSASGSGSGSGSYGHLNSRSGSGFAAGAGGSGSGGNGVGGSSQRVFITAWAVDRDYRGQGIGSALLDDAVRICRERGWGLPIWGLDCMPLCEDFSGATTGGKAGANGGIDAAAFRADRWHAALVDWVVGEEGRRTRDMLRKAVERDGVEGGGCVSGKGCKGRRP